MFNFKIKPKIKVKKLIQDQELEIKSLDTTLKYETEISKDVSFNAEITTDLNYQKDINMEDRVKSAKFSFTKKF